MFSLLLNNVVCFDIVEISSNLPKRIFHYSITMVLFNQALCLAAGCVSNVPNTTDRTPGSKITFPTNATCGEVNVFYT